MRESLLTLKRAAIIQIDAGSVADGAPSAKTVARALQTNAHTGIVDALCLHASWFETAPCQPLTSQSWNRSQIRSCNLMRKLSVSSTREWEPAYSEHWQLNPGARILLHRVADAKASVIQVQIFFHQTTQFSSYLKRVMCIQSVVEALDPGSTLRPRTDDAELFRHVYRELNAEADRLAGMEVDNWHVEPYEKPLRLLRLQFDGSSTATRAGCGWLLYGAQEINDDDADEWKCVAWHSFRLQARVSVMHSS